MASCGSSVGPGGSPVGQLRGNLGRIAARTNRRIYIRDDLERGAANSTGICWYAAALEHEAHVWSIGTRHFGLHVARVLRGHRVPGLRELGVVGLAGLGIVRARGVDHLCRKHSRNFRASAEPRLQTALGCRPAGKDWLELMPVPHSFPRVMQRSKVDFGIFET